MGENASFCPTNLEGDHGAYIEALSDFGPFAEITNLGSSVHFKIHSRNLIECSLKVNGTQAIPAQSKTLSASGKVVVKNLPRGRFHEIYQDYICGCIIRVAREVLALLPVEALIVTASVDTLDTSTGRDLEQPVLSVTFPRGSFSQLEFERLDPSDAVESFLHRGDFKASRKTEAFQPIVPLQRSDLPDAVNQNVDTSNSRKTLESLLLEIRALKARLPKVKVPELQSSLASLPA